MSLKLDTRRWIVRAVIAEPGSDLTARVGATSLEIETDYYVTLESLKIVCELDLNASQWPHDNLLRARLRAVTHELEQLVAVMDDVRAAALARKEHP